MDRPQYPTQADLANWFEYHAPSETQKCAYQRLRTLGHALAYGILDLCPQGADRTAAIRKVREAVMTANASIACDSNS